MTLAVLAERFDYHPNYLSNKFKKEKQFTVQEAILSEKLNRALFILRDQTERAPPSRSCRGASASSDPAYFSQLFKAFPLCSPNRSRPRRPQMPYAAFDECGQTFAE